MRMPAPGPGNITNDPTISGTGTGMGAGNAVGSGGIEGVQAGTINDAAQGAQAAAGDPSPGSGAAPPKRGNRMGDAASGGASGTGEAPPGTGAAPIESFEQPPKIIGPAHTDR